MVSRESKEERERTTGKTVSATVTQADGGRFPWVWAALLVVVGSGLGAWLVLRSTGGGVVRLVSDPPGAAVTIDGQQLPDLATPCTLPKLPAGQHALELTRRGWQKLTTELTVPERGEVTLPPFKLEKEPEKGRAAPPPAPPPAPEGPKKVSLTLKSSPAGALASIEGKKIGPTPLTVETVIDAEVPIKLELNGYRDFETTLKVTREEETFTLEKDGAKKKDKKEPAPAPVPSPAKKELGTVRFAVPPGTMVECGDVKLGEVPPGDKTLPAGTYKCTLTNPETKEKHVEAVKVEANTTTKVQFKFKE